MENASLSITASPWNPIPSIYKHFLIYVSFYENISTDTVDWNTFISSPNPFLYDCVHREYSALFDYIIPKQKYLVHIYANT